MAMKKIWGQPQTVGAAPVDGRVHDSDCGKFACPTHPRCDPGGVGGRLLKRMQPMPHHRTAKCGRRNQRTAPVQWPRSVSACAGHPLGPTRRLAVLRLLLRWSKCRQRVDREANPAHWAWAWSDHVRNDVGVNDNHAEGSSSSRPSKYSNSKGGSLLTGRVGIGSSAPPSGSKRARRRSAMLPGRSTDRAWERTLRASSSRERPCTFARPSSAATTDASSTLIVIAEMGSSFECAIKHKAGCPRHLILLTCRAFPIHTVADRS